MVMAENDKKIDERRSFEDGDGNVYYIAPPIAEDIRGADWNYSKVYTKALIQDISTAAEMSNILTKRGIIGPEFEQRQRELADTLSESILKLNSTNVSEERRESAIEVSEAREELFKWNQRLNGPMSNTCEQMADDARLEYLTAMIIQKENGEKVWNSYDNYLTEKSQNIALTARFEVMLYLQGLDSDFLNNTPEAVAMKEVTEEIQQSISEAIDAAAKVEEAKEDDLVVEEKPKTKTENTGTKKTTKRKTKTTK